LASHHDKTRLFPLRSLRSISAKGIRGTVLKMAASAVFCIAAVTTRQNCPAQDLPIAPEPHDASPQLQEPAGTLAALEKPAAYSPSASPASASAAGYIAARRASNPRIADSKFFLINGLHLGIAVLDVELTQRCIASHQCREGNPLMPSSQTGQLSIGIGYVALGSCTSYWLKKRRSPHWWLPPAAGIVGHAVGVATGLRY